MNEGVLANQPSYHAWLKGLDGYEGQIAAFSFYPPRSAAPADAAGGFAELFAALELSPYRHQAEALARLDEGTDWGVSIPGMPGAAVVDIMRETLAGRIALARDDVKGAVGHFGQAAEMQAALPYLEPPFWYYPARQSFAAALLMDGQAERAEQEFFATLVESPDNGWAYWGLAEARKAQGDEAGAEAARTMWRGAWAGEQEPALDRL